MAVSALLLTAGCGEATVTGVSRVSAPYDGPMHVEVVHDHPDVLKRSGAAGLALECDGKPYGGGGGNYDTGPETVESGAVDAFGAWVEESGVTMPDEGYVVERDDGDRVLFSYDVDGETKVAAIAADGMRGDGRTGWGVEVHASCDPSELPARVTEALGVGVWAEDGRRVPVTTVRSGQGAEHCDWQDITFLSLGEPPDETQFARDTEGELIAGYDAGSRVPAGATDTGFEREGRRLWTTDDAAYLVSTDDPDDVERWPVATEPIYCM